MHDASNVFARLRKRAIVLDLATRLLQAEIEQFQAQILEFTLGFPFVIALDLLAALINFQRSLPPPALKSGFSRAVYDRPGALLLWLLLR